MPGEIPSLFSEIENLDSDFITFGSPFKFAKLSGNDDGIFILYAYTNTAQTTGIRFIFYAQQGYLKLQKTTNGSDWSDLATWNADIHV